MPSTLRIALIGYGISGQLSHAYGILANDAFRIAAVCDLNPDNRERASNEHSCPVYTDYREMIAAEQLDIVSIVTRSDTHASIVCDCLAAGLHTVVTKPWALNEQEAEMMLSAEATSSGKIFPWVPMYWSPDYKAVSDLLAKKVIGKIFLIRRYHSDFRYRDDWQTETQFGGGYLLNWGMHIIQPVVGLAKSRVKRVFGQLQQTINPGDADDNFLAVLEFENGIRGIAEFTQSPHPFPGFVIQGTEGTIYTDAESVTVKKANPKQSGEVEVNSYPLEGKQFGDEAHLYRDIAADLLDGVAYPTPPQLALEGTKILDAVRKSHERGQTAEIE